MIMTIDTIVQTRAKNRCLLTLTDRKRRCQIIRLIPDKSAPSVNQALKSIPKVYQIHSIRADNASEFYHRIFSFFPCFYLTTDKYKQNGR